MLSEINKSIYEYVHISLKKIFFQLKEPSKIINKKYLCIKRSIFEQKRQNVSKTSIELLSKKEKGF